jgi:hypothetical protein
VGVEAMRPSRPQGRTLRPTSVGARLALPVAALVAVLAAGAIVIPHANASGKTNLRPPTLLWKSYPLVQRPRALQARTSASPRREATGPTTAQGRRLDETLLLTALLATLLAAGTVVFLRTPSAARVGGSLRERGGTRTRRPERRPHPRRRPLPRRPRNRKTAPPPPLQPEVTPEDVAEPDAAREDPATPEPPPDELQRVLDDLLTALQPGQQPTTQGERIPELELRELIVRKYTAPESARQRIEREIDAALERVESRRAAEARARAAQRTSLARSEIRLWQGVMKSRLYAVIVGSEHAFAVSEPFRSRDAAAPGPSAQRALSSLLAELSRAGWIVVEHGSAWHEHTLELFPADAGADSTVTSPEDDEVPKIVYRTIPRNGRADESRP